ncbi:MAG: sulfite exporter TauE/SafE family protein [Parcubacteria group bacterium]|nr:sulfite exporter TauE/SafE family protein [Parcubacteria group bacterium]
MPDFLLHLLPPYFEVWHLLASFLAGFIGEGYATIVGSGGVLIQFTLAAIGLPLAVVVATDIGGSQGADIGIVLASSRKVLSNKKLLFMLALPMFVGGVIGTAFLIYIPVVFLKAVLILGLSVLLIYVLIGKKAEMQAVENVHLSMRHYPFIFTLMFILGVYGNVSGVGVGTFSRFAYQSILRISFVEGLGLASLIALPPTLFSTVVTAFSGLIAWPHFLVIFVASFISANFMTRHIRKVPEKYLRVLLLTVVSLYLTYLIYSLF